MSYAGQQVTRLETLMSQCVGLQQATIDGQTVVYDDLLKQYNYWKSRQAREDKRRPRVAQIYLGSQ